MSAAPTLARSRPAPSTRPRDLGVNFPAIGGPRRSSTRTAQAVLAEAAGGVAPVLARRILAERDWRGRYPAAFVDLTLAEVATAGAARDVAQRGLRAAHEHFVFVTEDGELPLGAAPHADGPKLGTTRVAGAGARVEELRVPYRGELLRGSALLHQLDDWVARGVTEPSFAQAVGAVVRHPEWLDLRDHAFGLVGAGAAMGPFGHLVGWGATVAAVDLPRPEVWERLTRVTRESAGTMVAPVRSGADGGDPVRGADLLTEVGALARWLGPVGGPLTLGNYGYADGALFVRLSMAFDLLVEAVSRLRDDLSLGFLATPSDAFLVPEDAVRMAQERWRDRSAAARAVNLVTGGRSFRPNYSGLVETPHGRYGLVNAFIPTQGQNYAFAKRLQRWRMTTARDHGMVTAVHVAPPTRTDSVHKNPVMEQRQRLTARIGAEAFDAATSRALGAAMLVHDLRNPASPANPAVPLAHPHEAFMFAANPGGRWRMAFDPGSSVPALRLLDRAVRAVGGALD
jgi:hypothetical protein